MIKTEEALEKILSIEKAVNELAALRRGVLELKESEAQNTKALETMRVSENLYRCILENLPYKIFSKDTKSVYTFCNQKYADDLNMKSEEICGRTDYEFYPRDLAEQYASIERRIISEGTPEITEENYLCNGLSLLVHMFRTLIKDERGEITGVLCIFWDITQEKREEEKKKGEQQEFEAKCATEIRTAYEQIQLKTLELEKTQDQLRNTEEKYRTLTKFIGTPMVLIGSDMVISSVNREFEIISGYSRDEVEGKKSLNYFILDGAGEKFSNFILNNQNDFPENYETHFSAERGKGIRDIRVAMVKMPGVENTWMISLKDTTESKKAKESLRNIQENYNSLLELNNGAVFVIQEGLLKSFNNKLLAVTNFTVDELSSKPFDQFIHCEDQIKYQIYLQDIKNQESNNIQCFKLLHKDGHIIIAEIRGALINWEGKPAVLNFMTDVTESRQAEEELRNSIKPFSSLIHAIEKCFSNGNRLSLG